MTNIFENQEKFKTSIGHFLMQFSELEFSLLYYCGLIDHPSNQNFGIREHLQSTFEERRKKISKFIRTEIPELQVAWDTINGKLGEINRDRRFLVHGLGRSSFFQHSVKAYIPKKESVDFKEFSIDDINKLSNQISHLLTGDNGLNGEFLITFNTKLFDFYNRTTNEDNKIIYRVNDKILTEYKG